MCVLVLVCVCAFVSMNLKLMAGKNCEYKSYLHGYEFSAMNTHASQITLKGRH